MSLSNFQTFIAVFATISLFLYGLKEFSKEVKEISSAHFEKWLRKITRYSLTGFLFGGILTAIVQSSSAVSSITIALVDAGAIKFVNSLAVMLGANVGTTATAWLVTFKIGEIAPLFIVLGKLISFIPTKIRLAGKSIFYFGFVLFSLELISQAIEPLKNDPQVTYWLTHTNSHLTGVVLGIIVTVLVQSSSVTTGLAIILVQQGILSTEAAISIIIGSNLGTTSTALLASLQLNRYAKLAAKANFMFNLVGVIVCFPFISYFDDLASYVTNDIGFQVAFAHLFFNVIISLLLLPFLKQLGHWLKADEESLVNNS